MEDSHRREIEKLLNKFIVFVFFVQKKYSHSFIKLWLNHCCVALLSMQGQKALDFIKNILICVMKINEGFMGLERHEGE